jgi:hypothetical protein
MTIFMLLLPLCEAIDANQRVAMRRDCGLISA